MKRQCDLYYIGLKDVYVGLMPERMDLLKGNQERNILNFKCLFEL